MPPFVNAHTHLGDSVRTDFYGGKSQSEVVCEGGEKFDVLENASEEEKVEAMRESLSQMEESGTLAHLDFRENGIRGVELLRQAESEGIKSLVLSRPDSEDEIEKLLEISEGIGFPSLDLLPAEDIKQIARTFSKNGKLVSFHVSETKEAHEHSLEEEGETETQRALQYDPSFLVHGTWANEEDLKSMSQSKVPLVLCPRSNSLLAEGMPPIKKALEENVELWLGTDNVSVCPPIIFQELSFAWATLRRQSQEAGAQEARELLKAATANPTDDLNLPFSPLEEGKETPFLILSRKRNLRRCQNPHLGIVSRARLDNVEKIYFP